MNSTDYEYVCSFVREASGLSLGPNKEYLVTSRLLPLAQSYELEDIEALVKELRKGSEPRLKTAVTEAMTTNETLFFRDKTPFEDLKTVVFPELLKAREAARSVRIWCAACSTGQEPYSIAMLLDEMPEFKNWNVEIVATDIDTQALDSASTGIYSQFEVQRGLPIQLLIKHFQQVTEGWQIKENLRKQITWKQLNLLTAFTHFGPFDIVFCRNVLIYFDMETKQATLEGIRKVTQSKGYLFMGAAETVLGICSDFERYKECKSGVYRPTAKVSA